jgi:predicted phage terminase large subunit-like protein
MCEHLEAVARGQIKNIIINVPPRHAKSITCNVAFPAWVWAQPNKATTSGNGVRFLTATHSHTLALRDSVKCRQLIKSPWYQDRWGDSVRVKSDSDTKGEFNLVAGGGRLITSVDSRNTGHGGEILMFDDVIDASDIWSKAKREAVLEWWDGTMSTRDNAPDAARVVIMQRLHEQDLVGHILATERNKWEHLCLPAEYERNHIYPVRSSIGWTDPRKEEGELLWKERFSRERIEALKTTLRDKAAGQLQQRPSAAGGTILKRGSWQMWKGKVYPNFVEVLTFYDTAMEAKESNDFSASTTWGIFEKMDDAGNPMSCAMLLDRWKDKVEYPALKKHALEHYKKWKPDLVIIERKASGHILLQDLRKTGMPLKAFEPNAKSKEYRAQMGSDVLDAGRIFYPDKNWAREVIEECAQFPKGAHDDVVDTVVQCLLYLRKYTITLDADDSIDDDSGLYAGHYRSELKERESFY